MDYCTLCRRHLNGALTCPGCGVPTSSAAAVPPARRHRFTDAPAGDSTVRARSRRPGAVAAQSDAAPKTVPTGEGRAARRRLARWRTRRRRIAAGASLAVVALAGGLLTANVMPQSSHAATPQAAAPAFNEPVDTGHSASAARPSAPARATHRTQQASPQPTTATVRTTPLAPPPKHHPAPGGPTASTPSPTPPPRTSTPTPPPSGGSGEPTAAPTSAPAPAPTSRPTTAPTPTQTPKPVCVLVICVG